jgi:hypothetical protein
MGSQWGPWDATREALPSLLRPGPQKLESNRDANVRENESWFAAEGRGPGRW